jgi:protein involved in polysaccharide export with SLBB domain
MSLSNPFPAAQPNRAGLICLFILSLLLTAGAQAQGTTENYTVPEPAVAGGPVRLRQATTQPLVDDRLMGVAVPAAPALSPAASIVPYVPGEFERFVQRQAGPTPEVRRFGNDLIAGGLDNRGADLSPLVPADYVVAPGDEVLLTLWGSVDADLRLVVDRAGRIVIPRVGPVQVSGVRHADLTEVVSRRVAQVFKNFQISVTLGQLRGIRVFVTGFVVRPGTYTVSSLSTVVAALMRAGGPASSGSFRSIELRRGGQLLSSFDLYDLLLKGDRSADRIVQAGDVVHVGPVGVQVGFIGSVNKPTVLELKAGETVADALRIAGGFSAVADRSRLAVERLQERNAGRVAQLDLPADLKLSLNHGDVLRAFSAVDIALPSQRQNKRVRVEGEVLRPSEYVLPEGSSVADAIKAAGGFTNNAYVFATEFNRESVRLTQQENYDRALRDMETDFARASGSKRISTADEAASDAARAAATSRLIERLRTLRPSGRIVLQVPPEGTDLPNLALEDGDRIFIPARASTVGIFGSVFNAASYLYTPGRTLDDYLRLAGGPTKGADQGSSFVVRANGNVISGLQTESGWFSRSSGVGKVNAEPGDTVFVPEEMNKTTFIQSAKDWTLLLYQLGIGVAGIKSAIR